MNHDNERAALNYATAFEGRERAAKHIRKFSSRIDKVRDQIEVAALRRYARGRLFDCSIGFGRLVGRLPHVTSYVGADSSNSFVGHIQEHYPEVRVYVRNILEGINETDGTYDTVLCIRTLPVLPRVPMILAEMKRVAKPGGRIIVTYGRRPTAAAFDGCSYVNSYCNLLEVAATLGLQNEAIIPKDRLLVGIKRSRTAVKIFCSRYNVVPDKFYYMADLLVSKLFGSNELLYVFKK